MAPYKRRKHKCVSVLTEVLPWLSCITGTFSAHHFSPFSFHLIIFNSLSLFRSFAGVYYYTHVCMKEINITETFVILAGFFFLFQFILQKHFHTL